MPLIALVIGGYILIRFVRNIPERQMEPPHLQCAHWSVFRCCQLLGVPVGMDYLVEKLPYQEQGHSMLQISEVFQQIGFQTEGRQETLNTLEKLSFPFIAHLKNPDHYVVVSAIDKKYVHVFDGNGRRTARERSAFEKIWSGHLLLVHKPANANRLPAFLPKPNSSSPSVIFDCLIRDLGTVPVVGKPVAFHYSLRNVGNADLIIEDVRPDCSCIKHTKPDKPIKPGEEGIIELSYHVQPQTGQFSHDVIVKTNDPQIPVVVFTASGWSGVEVKVNPHQIWLHDAVNGYEQHVNCFIKYTGNSHDLQIDIGEVVLEHAKLTQTKIHQITKETAGRLFPEISENYGIYDNLRVLEMVFLPEGNISDRIEGTIALKTNIEGYENFTLNISGQIEPPIQIFPEIVNTEDHENTEITLLARIKEPFEVENVYSGEHDIIWEYTQNSDKDKTVRITTDAIKKNLSSTQTVDIKINFPKSKNSFTLPVRVIP
ncbi:MAG: DUF1573 domain-containing protein [Planctomycetaceae bacterium]|nr:DUF1573 domain-containing protein [Planctomycetaceae bacterium]